MRSLSLRISLVICELLIEPYHLVLQLIRREGLTWRHFVSPHHYLFITQLWLDGYAIYQIAFMNWLGGILLILARIGLAIAIYLGYALWYQIRSAKKWRKRKARRTKSSVAHP